MSNDLSTELTAYNVLVVRASGLTESHRVSHHADAYELTLEWIRDQVLSGATSGRPQDEVRTAFISDGSCALEQVCVADLLLDEPPSSGWRGL